MKKILFSIFGKVQSLKLLLKIVSIVWVFILLFVGFTFLRYKNSVKEFAVISGFSMVNGVIQSEYKNIILKLKTINVAEDIPLEKLESVDISDFVNSSKKYNKKIGKVKGVLGSFGVKTGGSFSDGNKVVAKLEKLNRNIETVKTDLVEDVQKAYTRAIDREGKKFLIDEISKNTGLNGVNLDNFLSGDYGILSAENRKSTESIYRGLISSKSSIVVNVVNSVDAYFKIGFWIFLVLYIIVGLFPICVLWIYILKKSFKFIKCPKCKAKLI